MPRREGPNGQAPPAPSNAPSRAPKQAPKQAPTQASAPSSAADDHDADWAHAPPADGLGPSAPHLLDDHLVAVGRLAAELAPAPLRAWAAAAGQWHDLGKRRIGFVRYIRSANGAAAHIEQPLRDQDKTHSAAGALWAERWLTDHFGRPGSMLSRVLQYVIAGHHAGLDDWEGRLSNRLASPEAQCELADSLDNPRAQALLAPPDPALALTDWPLKGEADNPGRVALWVRMLFSALVDADFLDTEAYFNPQQAAARASTVGISDLLRACDAHLDALAATAADTPVMRQRAKVLRQCRDKAALPPGVFTLAVPTGGGKTLSSLAFALRHAAANGQRRVVYAIPYTSIIEQTADVFRQVFAAFGPDAVLEHHSSVESDPQHETPRSRLACENWDAPLVVTTNVQLFESLFASRPSRCRKLHRLVGSVIVLDEAQLLPVEFLQPVVDVLRLLVRDFGASVVLCTATQPVLDAAASADPRHGLRRGIGAVTRIIDDEAALYSAMQRVRVHLPASLEAPTPWAELADALAGHDAVLAIVYLRADARELHRLLRQRVGDAGCWHLSALMCPQHRSDTLRQIRAALAQRREALAAGLPAPPVRIVATTLVNCGVDIDLPVVYTALSGLDAVAQAAGRCNREGRLAVGEVHVFVPPTKPPQGLRPAVEQARRVWHDRPTDPLAPLRVKRYFSALYHDAASLDAHDIVGALWLKPDAKHLALPIAFRRAAQAFRFIDDAGSATVLVRYRSPHSATDIDALIAQLQREGPSRRLLRQVQRWGVTLRERQWQALLKAGDIEPLNSCPGLYAQRAGWDALYDDACGLQVDGPATLLYD